jgi:prophage regulatory protein
MKMLSIGELKSEKGISYSKPHLYRLIKAGKFPRPVPLGENRIGFVEAEIEGWLQAKVAERDGRAPENREGV